MKNEKGKDEENTKKGLLGSYQETNPCYKRHT
jgi:hypothetical protein